MAQGNTSTIRCFTEKRLLDWATAGCGDKAAVIYRDEAGPQKEGVAGMCFVVQQKKSSFAFEGRIDGKSFRLVIGRYPDWPLGKARDRAREIQRHLDKHEDPRLIKKQKRAANQAARAAIKAEAEAKRLEEQKATVEVRELWDAYIDAKKSGWGERHLRDYANLAQVGGEKKSRGKGLTKPGPLAPVLATPIIQVDEDFLKHWLSTESATRANNARQAFEALRACWRWAAKHKDYRDLIPDATLFENEELLSAKPKRRAASERDVLERAHLSDWFQAVQAINNKELSVYLQVLLLTGARRSELLELKWSDIDQREPACVWVKDKVEEAGRHIPLGAYSAWLLSSLPKRKYLPEDAKKERDVEWVFSGPDIGNAHIHQDTPGAAHRRALAKVGLEVSLHGLRRSYATLNEWLETPSGILAQVQGHKASAVQERHYKRRPLELLAQYHSRFEAWVLREAGVDFDAGTVVGGLRVVK